MPEPREARDLFSLSDEPCRYPDPRPAAERRPYLYRHGLLYDIQPQRETVASLDEVPVDLGDRVVSLVEALERVGGAPLDQRIPVLAVGSNGYPRQLLDKFEGLGKGERIQDDSVIVMGCSARGLRIAYCAGYSRKGYVPVTVCPDQEALTHTWLQWLTTEQLAAVARTEGSGYRLVECGLDAAGASAVAMHGVAEGPARVYAWCYEALLAWPGEELAPLLYAGNPPEGYSGEARGVPELTVLQDAVQRMLTVRGETLTWDGCHLPESHRRDLRVLLERYRQPLPLPAWWSVVERGVEGFAEAMKAG